MTRNKNSLRGRNSRIKGHNFERKWAKHFRKIGFSHTKTSREASKLLDDSAVDLAFLPFNIQLKHTVSNVKYREEFLKIEERLKKNYGEDHDINGIPKLVIHKQGRKKYSEIVVIPYEDFINLLEDAKYSSLKKKNNL